MAQLQQSFITYLCTFGSKLPHRRLTLTNLWS